jgi:hypothetical protein
MIPAQRYFLEFLETPRAMAVVIGLDFSANVSYRIRKE